MRSGRSRPITGTALRHLGTTRLTIPYPWVDGEAHVVRVLTSTGTTFEHEIPVAVATPQPDARYLWRVHADRPVRRRDAGGASGCCGFRSLSRLGATGMDFCSR